VPIAPWVFIIFFFLLLKNKVLLGCGRLSRGQRMEKLEEFETTELITRTAGLKMFV